MKLFVQHVERCMEARLESYRTAYNEAKHYPTEDEFSEILASIQDVQKLQSQHSTHALGEFAKSHGGYYGVTFDLITGSAHGHDRVLRDWKVWRGQVNLAKTVGPDDQTFALMAKIGCEGLQRTEPANCAFSSRAASARRLGQCP